MKKQILFASAFLTFVLSALAQVPPPEKLLPPDTLILLTAPDAAKFMSAAKASPQGQLWNDPSMKAFKDKFMDKLDSNLLSPLEKELRFKFSDYRELAQGQVTFALTQNEWNGKTNATPGWILLLDVKDKTGLLKTNLAKLKKDWIDGSKQIKTEKIRDLEFNTFITSTDAFVPIFENIFPRGKDEAAAEKPPGRKLEILVGQSGSLLLVGNSAKVIEQVLVHQAAGLAPSLADEAAYVADHGPLFRDAPFYAWISVKPFVDIFLRNSNDEPAENPLMPKPDKIATSTGIAGLKTIAFSYRHAPEGATMQLALGVPEANRQGLFKLLAAEAKEATSPAFIPADATKFMRWRLNLAKAWTGLEGMLTEMSPAMGGAIKLIFDSAGKDKDPNFDLRKELLATLGDDLINYQRKPAVATLAELNSPPSIYLLGSSDPEKLATAIKVGMSLLAPAPIKERDFLGRKIYMLPSSGSPAGAKAPERNLSFSASGGYLALSTSTPMLEEYLRGNETKPKALSEIVGFNEAAEKVGGTRLGLFGYNNQVEAMRGTFTALKNESVNLSDLVKSPALKTKTPEDEKKINDWADFSLLPPFETVSKYFHFSVYGGGFNANGFNMKFFHPTPPELKK